MFSSMLQTSTHQMAGEQVNLQLSCSFSGYTAHNLVMRLTLAISRYSASGYTENQSKKAGDASIFWHTGTMRGRQSEYRTKKWNFISLQDGNSDFHIREDLEMKVLDKGSCALAPELGSLSTRKENIKRKCYPDLRWKESFLLRECRWIRNHSSLLPLWRANYSTFFTSRWITMAYSSRESRRKSAHCA